MKIMNKVICGVKCRTHIVDWRTGYTLKVSPWQHNTVMNGGLNALAAGGVGLSGFYANTSVGSSNTQNYTFNSGVTFTQVGNVITASGSFFLVGMVGQLFKYGTGTGGAEYYIVGYTSATSVTVDTSATVATPSQGAVWNVTQTTLGAFLYYTSNITSAFQSFPAPGVVTVTTFNRFAVQSTTYTVNEIGYSNLTGNNINGRIVLASSDVVPPSSYYVVESAMTFTASPCAAAAAVANVGTGINTAGNALWAYYSYQFYQESQSGYNSAFMDSMTSIPLTLVTSAITLPSTVQTGASPINPAGVQLALNGSYAASGIGISTYTSTFNTTTTGQTVYGLMLGGGNNASFDFAWTGEFQLAFTTPQTLPNGAFVGSWQFQNVFGRTLSNP
jgi:hypothetical protein